MRKATLLATKAKYKADMAQPVRPPFRSYRCKNAVAMAIQQLVSSLISRYRRSVAITDRPVMFRPAAQGLRQGLILPDTSRNDMRK